MSKTNHQRGNKDNTDHRSEYILLEVKQECPDGSVVRATAVNGDSVNCGERPTRCKEICAQSSPQSHQGLASKARLRA
jgi:hypothetical protein